MTKSEAICQEIVLRLKTLTLVPAASVYEDRPRDLSKEQVPAINVFFPKEDLIENLDELKKWRLLCHIVIAVRDDDAPRALVQAIRQEAHDALIAGENLGGLCSLVSGTGWDWNRYDADEDGGELTVPYEISFHTLNVSLN